MGQLFFFFLFAWQSCAFPSFYLSFLLHIQALRVASGFPTILPGFPRATIFKMTIAMYWNNIIKTLTAKYCSNNEENHDCCLAYNHHSCYTEKRDDEDETRSFEKLSDYIDHLINQGEGDGDSQNSLSGESALMSVEGSDVLDNDRFTDVEAKEENTERVFFQIGDQIFLAKESEEFMILNEYMVRKVERRLDGNLIKFYYSILDILQALYVRRDENRMLFHFILFLVAFLSAFVRKNQSERGFRKALYSTALSSASTRTRVYYGHTIQPLTAHHLHLACRS